MGNRADDEADARAAAAFENADLYALHRLLRMGAGKGRNQHGGGDAAKNVGTTHEGISGWKI
jgi:hypothetical protein